MIEFVEIHNFEAWEHLRLDLEQTTTIIGLSDVGKSAALRALRWCCTNEPSGTDFIRWGADTCEVVVGVDGHVVRRVRGKTANSYFLDDTEFKAFGLAVPEPIKALFRLDAGGLNFQQQADAHLWLGVTPSALLTEINRLVDMSCVDTAVATLAHQHRQAKNEIMVADAEYDAAMLQVSNTAHAPEQFELALQVVEASDAHTAAEQRVAMLAGAVAAARAAVQAAEAAVAQAVPAKAARQAGVAWQAAEQRRASLAAAVQTARDQLLVICFGKPEQPRDLERAKAVAEQAQQRRAALVGVVDRALHLQKQTATTLAAIQRAEAELGKIETCPTCKRPI